MDTSDDDSMTEHLFAVNQAAAILIAAESDSDSDAEIDERRTRWGGSVKGKAKNKERGFDEAYQKITRDCFSGSESIYDESDFERRFRMPRSVFSSIANSAIGTEPFVKHKSKNNAPTIHPLCRLVGAMRQLSYGVGADGIDECCRMSETAQNEALHAFAEIVIENFGDEHFNRCPTQEEKMRCLDVMERRGFRGCFGSWDCKHFAWDKCPQRRAGSHKGRSSKKTLVIETLVDLFAHIWCAHISEPGSLNDIDVLDRSDIIESALTGSFDLSVLEYETNGRRRDWMCFLVDGIYVKPRFFVQSLSIPTANAEKKFSSSQESSRKDVERGCGILVQENHLLKNNLRLWSIEKIKNIMKCAMIIHNVVVKERLQSRTFYHYVSIENAEVDQNEDNGEMNLFGVGLAEHNEDATTLLGAQLSQLCSSCYDENGHNLLKQDLIAHFGNAEE